MAGEGGRAGAGWAAVLLALGLRGAWLGAPVFWHDEVYSRFFASGLQAEDWKPVLFSGEVVTAGGVVALQRSRPDRGWMDTVRGLARDEPQHPPLYCLLLRLWAQQAGEGAAALRALTVLLSLAGLPAMGWLLRELTGDRRIARIGVLLLAVSPFFVLYAREVREYALWTVWIMASSAALLRAIRKTERAVLTAGRGAGEGEVRAWLLFSALTTLSLYTSLSSATVILAQIAFLLVRAGGARPERRPARALLAGGAALAGSGLCFLPWAIQVWQHREAFAASMAWSKTITVPVAELLSTFILHLSRPIVDLWAEPSGWEHAAVWAAAALALAGVAGLRRLSPGVRWLPILLFLGPVAMFLAPDLLYGGIRSISTRYMTPSLVAVVAGLAVWAARGAGWRRTAPLSLLMAGSSLHAARDPAVWTKGISRGLPEVARLVAGADRAGGPALVVGNMEQHHPGNLLALCALLPPETGLQFLVPGVGYERPWAVPEGFGRVYLFSPIPPFVEGVRRDTGLAATEVYRDTWMSLSVLSAPDQRPGWIQAD